MYFIHNSENQVYFGYPSDGIKFDKFSALDDCIQISIFNSKSDACSCANMIQRESNHVCGILPLSELESFLKRV